MKKWTFLLCLPLIFLMGCGEDSIKPLDYVQLGQYKGLQVERMSDVLTDEEIDEQLAQYTASTAVLERIEDRTDVQEGDVANIDYEGSVDGVVFAGGSAQGYDLGIGSGTFIPGFEEGLIGANVGDTLDVNVTFPEQYPNNPDLAGKPAVFKVTVNYISRKNAGEVTDEVISQISGGQFTDVASYKEYIRQQMQSSLTSYADSTMTSDLLNQAVANATLVKDIPADYIESRKQCMIRTAKSNAEAYGVSYEDYLSRYLQMDEETFFATIDKTVDDIAKQSLVVMAIAEIEGVEISDEELANAIDTTMKTYGYATQNDLFKTINKQDYIESMLLDRVKKVLVENAEIIQK